MEATVWWLSNLFEDDKCSSEFDSVPCRYQSAGRQDGDRHTWDTNSLDVWRLYKFFVHFLMVFSTFFLHFFTFRVFFAFGANEEVVCNSQKHLKPCDELIIYGCISQRVLCCIDIAIRTCHKFKCLLFTGFLPCDIE